MTATPWMWEDGVPECRIVELQMAEISLPGQLTESEKIHVHGLHGI